MSDQPPQRATFDAADLAWEPTEHPPKPGDSIAITNSAGDVLAMGVVNEDGIIEFPTAEETPWPFDAAQFPSDARKILQEWNGLRDPDDVGLPSNAKDLERYYDVKAELGEQAINLLKHLVKADTIRMAEVADLVAGVRSKNGYQMNEGEIAKLREAERIIVRVSGAYATPEMFARTLVFKKEP